MSFPSFKTIITTVVIVLVVLYGVYHTGAGQKYVLGAKVA